ncbi:unnamed protein product [Rhizophagus irregularis]|nr:unnamed protein product [Rhizophagus irregularis]
MDSYGAKFPLQSRDETMRVLFNGNGAREGMCQRFENQIPTLLREHAENYTNDDELLNRIKYRMCTINVTFGNGTPASEENTSIGQISVALRILYENFISETLGYGEFLDKCSSDENGFIKLVILGIDELNILHNKRGHDNPVREIVHAVGGLSCSDSRMFYMLILAGTIQDPHEEMSENKNTVIYPTTSPSLGSGGSEN